MRDRATRTATVDAGEHANQPVRPERHAARRCAVGLAVACVVLAIAVVASLAIGAIRYSPLTVIEALLSPGSADRDVVIIRTLRLPRTLLGLVVGAALGVAGAITQGLTRNPVAEPGILGVNAGAALFVALGIVMFDASSLLSHVWLALIGAAFASVCVFSLGTGGRDGATNPARLLIAGAALTAALSSVTSALVLVETTTLDEFRFWLVGALSGRTGDVVSQIAPVVAIGLVASVAIGGRLNVLSLGNDVAAALGVDVRRWRIAAGAVVVVLCGGATAAVGPIGFIGLVVPHVARWIVGPDYRWIIALSAVIAPALLLLADTSGRMIGDSEVQAGVMTALVGAPVFLLLLHRNRMKAV